LISCPRLTTFLLFPRTRALSGTSLYLVDSNVLLAFNSFLIAAFLGIKKNKFLVTRCNPSKHPPLCQPLSCQLWPTLHL
jgi:hypothetical protein